MTPASVEKIPSALVPRGTLAGHPNHCSRAAGLAATSLAISYLNRAALTTVNAAAAHHQANATMP